MIRAADRQPSTLSQHLSGVFFLSLSLHSLRAVLHTVEEEMRQTRQVETRVLVVHDTQTHTGTHVTQALLDRKGTSTWKMKR